MSTLAFIVLMTKALAWPLIALLVFSKLRDPLLDLIPALRELKYGNLHMTFRDKVRELADSADALFATMHEPRAASEDQRLDALATLSPRSAILEAWIPVERETVGLALRKGLEIDPTNYRSPREVIAALKSKKIVSGDEVALFNQLRELRNYAAHATEFQTSPDAVKQFIDLSARLAAALATR